jgi:large repetitive protein
VLTNAYYHGVSIFNFAGTITDANISNNTITSGTTTGTGGTSQGSGIQFVGFGSATTVSSVTKAEITGNHINNFPGGDPVALEFGNSNASGPSGSYGTPGNATNVISVTGNTIVGGGTPNPNNVILAVLDGKGQGHFDISSNTLSGSAGNTIDISSQGSANLSVNVANNNIDDTTQDVSGTGGIAAGAGEFQVSDGTFLTDPTLTVAITGNTIAHNFGAGIRINDADGSPTINATINNNTVATPGEAFEEGIQVEQLPAATNSTLNLDIAGNTTAGSAEAGVGTAPGIGLREDTSGGNVFNIKGLTPNPANGPQTITFVNGENPNSAPDSFGDGGTDIINGGTSTFHAIASVPQPLFAAAGGVQATAPTPGEMNLTQTELDSVVAAAIGEWATAGASASQLAALHATTFSVADLSGDTIGEESSPAHITIDVNAAGNGWFVDPTPSNNSAFPHAQNAGGTDLLTDSSNAAAGHMDLLTAVMHEMGHVLGLPDLTSPADANDLMYINLVDGERRLPDGADVGQSLDGTAVAGIKMPTVGLSPAPIPTSAAAPPQGGAPIVAGNDTIDAGFGGKTLVGSAGADNFVFGSDIHLGTPTAPSAQPITHVADYSAAQGDTFDFSVLTSAFHALNVADASLVRAVEDPNGTFAMLQLNIAVESGGVTRFSPPAPAAPAANWVNVAQIDGAHTGDPVNLLIDSQAAIHLAQIHVGLLV